MNIRRNIHVRRHRRRIRGYGYTTVRRHSRNIYAVQKQQRIETIRRRHGYLKLGMRSGSERSFNVQVRENQRGKGIGTALIMEAVRRNPNTTFRANDENPTRNAVFYAKNGFIYPRGHRARTIVRYADLDPKNIPKGFRLDTDVGTFDYEIKLKLSEEYRKTHDPRHSEFDMRLASVPPRDFLEMQYEQAHLSNRNMTFEQWLRPWLDNPKIDRMIKTIQTGKSPKHERFISEMGGIGFSPPIETGHGLPIPIQEVKHDGSPAGWQEGRHRALAAIKVGLKTMPVWIARRREFL